MAILDEKVKEQVKDMFKELENPVTLDLSVRHAKIIGCSWKRLPRYQTR
jgi:hypothetical protein